MKKILALLSVVLFGISNANAGILSPFASTFVTLELGKSVMSHKSINSKFKNSNDFPYHKSCSSKNILLT